MTLKTQKIITVSLVSLAVLGGLEALAYIVNLNQIHWFLWTALAVWLYLWLKMSFLYDLHFKRPGAMARARAKHVDFGHWLKRYIKIFSSAIYDRFEHFITWHLFVRWVNYLLLPGLIFWATVVILYLNIGKFGLQQIFILLSSSAIAAAYWHIKEIYTAKEETISFKSFAVLSAIKIYTVLAVYGAALHYAKYNCDVLPSFWLGAMIFAATFLILYQALFQHGFTSNKNLFWAVVISGAQAILGMNVYLYWGYEYLNASIFLTAFYNLFWGIFHHSLEGTLSRRVFWEIVFISLVVALLALSATNFKAQISFACGV